MPCILDVGEHVFSISLSVSCACTCLSPPGLCQYHAILGTGFPLYFLQLQIHLRGSLDLVKGGPIQERSCVAARTVEELGKVGT